MLRRRSTPQLFSSHLPVICDPRHPIRILADGIDWESLISRIAAAFPATTGRPPEDPRLVLGLLLLKDTFGESDESCVARFVGSIYWQYCHNRQLHLKHHRVANNALKELRTKLGVVMRDLQRKVEQAKHVRCQVKQKKAAGRVFSIHEPEVDYIGKGKAHKKWELGRKLGLVSTSRSNSILTSKAYPELTVEGASLGDWKR